MSLWFNLMVNAESIGRLIIQRVAPLGATLDPDQMSVYEVTLDNCFVGRLEHRYGDGAWELARRALELHAAVGGLAEYAREEP